jgi:hypothetical protein
MTVDSNEADKVQSILDRVASAGEFTEENLAFLRRALISSGNSNTLQFGKYNIHINDGKHLQIGDRTYHGPDLETLLRVIRQAQNEIIEDRSYRALQAYFQALRVFCNNFPYLSLDDLLVRERKTLEEIYVPLRVRFQPNSIFLGTGSTIGIMRETTIADVLRQAETSSVKHFLILGDPGAGKSTLLRQIAQNSWHAPSSLGLDHPHFAMVVRLRSLVVSGGVPVGEMLLKASELILLEQPPADFITLWSKQMQASWFILLDGLDEVPFAQRSAVTQWVKDFSQAIGAQGHHVVITSRPVNDPARRLGEQFAVYELLPFSKSQQEKFAQRWFKTSAEKFLIELGRMRTSELHGTPLLLTIAAAVYSSDNQLPERRSSLYERFISIWIEEAQKRGLIEDLGERLSKMTRLALEYFAHMATEYPNEVLVTDFSRWAKTFLQDAMAFSSSEASANSQYFVEVLSRRSGVFIRRGEVCEWLHPTFREYLTASFVVRECENSHRRIWKRLAQNWREPPLEQIIIFATSIMSDNGQDADYFLERISRKGINGALFAAELLLEHVQATAVVKKWIVDTLNSFAKNESITEGERISAIEMLGRLGITDQLLLYARSTEISPRIKVATIETLLQQRQTTDLLSLIQDEQLEDSVREKSAAMLLEQGYKEEALNCLTSLGRNEETNSNIRLEVAETLWNIGEHNTASAILKSVLPKQDWDDQFHEKAIDLSMIMGFFAEVTPLIMKSILAQSYSRRIYSWVIANSEQIEKNIMYLERLDRVQELMILAQNKSDKYRDWMQNATKIDKAVRDRAILALTRLGRVNELLFTVQRSQLEAEHYEVILKSLVEIGDKNSLLSLAMDEKLDKLLRVRASQYLYSVGGGNVVLNFWISSLLTAREVKSRINAAEVVSQLRGGKAAVRIILLNVLWQRLVSLSQQQPEALSLNSGQRDFLISKFISLINSKALPQKFFNDAVAALATLGQINDLISLAEDESLAAIGKIEIADILENLGHRDDATRIRLMLAPDLLSIVRHKETSSDGRKKAIRLLGNFKRTNDLISLAEDESLAAIGKIEIADILENLGHRDDATRIRLMLAPDLLSIVRHKETSSDERKKAIRLLGNLERINDLLLLVKDDTLDTFTKKDIAEVLIRLDSVDKVPNIWSLLIPDLLYFVRDKYTSQNFRERAVEYLSTLGRVDDLVSLASDENLNVFTRKQVLICLINHGHIDNLPPDWPKLVPNFWLYLKDKNLAQQIRKNTINALADSGKIEDLILLAKEKSLDALTRKKIADRLVPLKQVDGAIEIWLLLARDVSLDKKIRKNAIYSLSSAGRNRDLIALVETQQLDKWGHTFIKQVLARSERRMK